MDDCVMAYQFFQVSLCNLRFISTLGSANEEQGCVRVCTHVFEIVSAFFFFFPTSLCELDR